MSRYHRIIARNAEGQSDVYDVLRAFNVTDPAVAHAIKKLLAPGQRAGGKSAAQDLEEAKWSVDCAIKSLPGESCDDEGCPHYGTPHGHPATDESRPVDWDETLKGMVDKAAEEVKESFKAMERAPTWHTKGYQDAVERAREAHFATLRRNGIDTPVADCNDPYGIKDLGNLSFDELYRLLEREDRPGPRRDAIASAMQTAGKTPIEDTDGAAARWAAKREVERGAPPTDDPRPRAETIVVADKYITPMREDRGLFGWRRPSDDPGAGVYFERSPWWWPF